MFSTQTQIINTKWVHVSPEAFNRLFDTMETQLFVSEIFVFLNISMTELTESLICHARSHISFKSNGTTPLDDFGTSPPTHGILLHVDTAGALRNGHASTGVSGILWIYKLYCWLCSVIEDKKDGKSGVKQKTGSCNFKSSKSSLWFRKSCMLKLGMWHC